MNAVIESLMEDHRYMIRMTYLLEKELRALTGLSKREAQKEKILDILQYLKGYSAIAHHKLEDFLFERLLDKGLEMSERAEVSIVMNEHESLDVLSELLEQTVSEFMTGNKDVAKLLRMADQCKDMQFSHIEKEQKSVMPLMGKYLNEQDWEDAESYAAKISKDAKEQDLWRLIWMRERLSQGNAITSA